MKLDFDLCRNTWVPYKSQIQLALMIICALFLSCNVRSLPATPNLIEVVKARFIRKSRNHSFFPDLLYEVLLAKDSLYSRHARTFLLSCFSTLEKTEARVLRCGATRFAVQVDA